MNAKRRRWVHGIGLIVFAVVLVFSVRESPPDLRRLEIGWLLVASVMVALTIGLQVFQTSIFLRAEGVAATWTWSAWFTSEKAWMNTVFPAKVGTAGAMLYLDKAHGIDWHRYLRYMLMCGGVTAAASISVASALLFGGVAGAIAAALVFLIAMLVANLAYPLPHGSTLTLAASSVATLATLTLGVGACIRGLGHDGDWHGLLPVGAILNLLSVVAVTPGNFGFRELVLASAAPLLDLDFGVVVQASTCYVFLRLLASLALATALRSRSIGPSG